MIIVKYQEYLFDKIYISFNTDLYASAAHMYFLLSDIYKRMTVQTVLLPGKISVHPAVEYIENNYNMPVSIEKLELLCHSCNSGFFRLFKQAVGVTPITYKHNIMVQNALDLLAHTDLTIEEISSKVGFSSSNYFRKVFFDITGKTPKEVR